MIDSEDSVVTSLNELRKLKNERKSRKNKNRQRANAARSQPAPVSDPSADMVTPPPSQPMSTVAARPSQNFAQAPAPVFAMPAPAPQPMFAAPPTLVKQKSSATPAILVALLLIGAGAAGYFKLQTDTKALLDSKDVAIRDAEEARNQAIEANARMELLAKNNLAKCEEKLKLASATPAPTSVAPAVAPIAPVDPKPAVAKTTSSSRRSASKASSRHSSSRSRRVASSSDKAQKPGAVPNIAKKKTLQDDPLAGLGLGK
jgi:hypothetical protein